MFVLPSAVLVSLGQNLRGRNGHLFVLEKCQEAQAKYWKSMMILLYKHPHVSCFIIEVGFQAQLLRSFWRKAKLKSRDLRSKLFYHFSDGPFGCHVWAVESWDVEVFADGCEWSNRRPPLVNAETIVESFFSMSNWAEWPLVGWLGSTTLNQIRGFCARPPRFNWTSGLSTVHRHTCSIVGRYACCFQMQHFFALRTYLCTHARASLVPLHQGHLTMDAPLLSFLASMSLVWCAQSGGVDSRHSGCGHLV